VRDVARYIVNDDHGVHSLQAVGQCV
jgi:hypothetical protein